MSLYPGNSGTYLHGNFGYPYRGSPRRKRPTVLLVVHITGNSRLPSALAEMQYSARDGSGASFTFAVNRNGTVVQGLHPETQTPWTNGDLNKPTSPVTQAMVGSPYNANEFCFMTAENVGYNPGYLITAAQIDSLARLAAWGSKIADLPVNRNTVLGHREFNSVGRYNCPTPGDLNAFLNQIITKANAILYPPQENIMALLPVELYPKGTRASFAAATKYSFYRIVNDKVERKEWTPTSSTSATAGAKVALDGDTARAGIYVLDGIHAGWTVSGWGELPTITPPADPTVPLKQEITSLKDRITRKNLMFDRIGSETPRLASSGKAI